MVTLTQEWQWTRTKFTRVIRQRVEQLEEKALWCSFWAGPDGVASWVQGQWQSSQLEKRYKWEDQGPGLVSNLNPPVQYSLQVARIYRSEPSVLSEVDSYYTHLTNKEPGMVAHICNPSIREAEIGGSWIWGQFRLHSKNLSQNKQEKKP